MKRLIEKANEAGGDDNITVVLVKIDNESGAKNQKPEIENKDKTDE